MSPTASALLLAALLGAPTPTTPPAAPPAAKATPAPANQPAQPADPSGCSGTLSGAVTATFACSVETRIEGGLAKLVVSVEGPVAGVRALQPATVSLPVPLPSGSYTGAALKSASSSVETAAGASFAAGPGRGEVTLVVDQAEQYRQMPNHLVMSGSIKARLVPAKGGKGEVVVEIKF